MSEPTQTGGLGTPPSDAPQMQPPSWPLLPPANSGPTSESEPEPAAVPPMTGSTSPPRRSLPGLETVVLVVAAVMIIVAAAVIVPHLAGNRQQPDPHPTPVPSPSVRITPLPPNDALAAGFAPLGFQCLQELPSPVINGCHLTRDRRSSTLRWLKQGEETTAFRLTTRATRDNGWDEFLMQLAMLDAILLEPSELPKLQQAVVAAGNDDKTRTLKLTYGEIRVSHMKSIDYFDIEGNAKGVPRQNVPYKQFPGTLNDARAQLGAEGFHCSNSAYESDCTLGEIRFTLIKEGAGVTSFSVSPIDAEVAGKSVGQIGLEVLDRLAGTDGPELRAAIEPRLGEPDLVVAAAGYLVTFRGSTVYVDGIGW